MNKFVLLAVLALATTVSASQVAYARNAGLLLSPTRLVLGNGQRYATVTVRNNGDGVGRYVIEVVDAAMAENGGIKILDQSVQQPNSALNLVSISPHSITLKPDDYQTVRILVKNASELPDGEYRSHLQVRMTQADITNDDIKPDPQNTVIVPRALMTTVIPIIIRKGETHFVLSIDDAKLAVAAGQPQVDLTMSFSGNSSVIGDVRVSHTAPNGTVTPLAFYRGIAIYRDVRKRTQPVPLEVPKGVNIHQGKIDISFMSQDNPGAKVLAQKTITAH